MIDNAAVLALGCVGGIVIAGLVAILALSYTVGELGTLFRQWIDRR